MNAHKQNGNLSKLTDTKKSKQWTQWDEDKSNRLNLWAAQMIVQQLHNSSAPPLRINTTWGGLWGYVLAQKMPRVCILERTFPASALNGEKNNTENQGTRQEN